MTLGEHGAARRVEQLIRPEPRRRRATALVVLATTLTTLSFGLLAALPVAVAGATEPGPHVPDRHCSLHLRG